MASGVRPARGSAEGGWPDHPRVFRSSADQNEVVILFDTDDMKKAKDFVASPELKVSMAKSGVWTAQASIFLNQPSR